MSPRDAAHRTAGRVTGRSRSLTIAVDVLCLGALIVVAGLALAPAYGGWRWLLALAAGALTGAAAVIIPLLLRWPALSTVAFVIAGYFLIGPAAAAPSSALLGFLPSLESLRLLALGVISGWKQMLTVADPIGSGGGLLIPAFLIGLLAAVASVVVAVRTRHTAWALVAPAVVLGAAALLGTVTGHLPMASGIAVAAGGLAWGAWHRGGFQPGGIDLHRPIALAALVAVMAGAGWLLPDLVAPATPRLALREMVKPQFDPLTYPSPLAAFRRYVKADANTALFTVTGLPADGRIRLATLDSYNGVFYNVSTAAGRFIGVGDVVRTDEKGTAVSLDVTVDEYAGVWLPDIGTLTGITFSGERAGELAPSLRYSRGTGTAVVPAGLKSGDEYHVSGIVPEEPDAATLKTMNMGAAPVGDTGRVPTALTALAATLTEGTDTVYDAAEAIRNGLATRGLLSHGDTLRSPSGHGYDRLVRLLDGKEMVGDQEQYAPLMALMLRSLGIPARVVLGFAPKDYDGSGELTVLGSDISAWVEVDFDRAGWVPFDPTPDEARVSEQQTPQPQSAPHQLVLQPPPPPRVQDKTDSSEVKDEDADEPDQDDDASDDAAAGGVPWLLVGGIGMPVLLLVGPVALILLLKARRRRRQRRGSGVAQVAGGWDHLLDRAVDLGAEVPEVLTRNEKSRLLEERFEVPLLALARAADAKVFGPGEADAADSEAYWAEVGGTVRELKRAVSPWRRMRASISTLSLRREGRP